MKKTRQNKTNHVVLVLDGSHSMLNRWGQMAGSRAEQLIPVADSQIAYLARRSQELDQETRVTIVQFASQGEYQVLVWDMDVLRLPSIKELYQPYGNTAMCEGVLLALADLALISEKYGDHAFLMYVFTDGEENDSSHEDRRVMPVKLNALPDNWTVACLVPDIDCKREAADFGFPRDNIQVWDVNSSKGVSEAGNNIREATDRWMTGRASGVRSTRTLFSTGADAVNASTIQAAGLKPLRKDGYVLVPVHQEGAIRDWVTACGYHYVTGNAFYELSKTETIQGNKALAVVDRTTNEVFTGDEVRDMIGLSNVSVRVRPDFNLKYRIFVQSTSVNRKLLPGTQLLIMDPLR